MSNRITTERVVTHDINLLDGATVRGRQIRRDGDVGRILSPFFSSPKWGLLSVIGVGATQAQREKKPHRVQERLCSHGEREQVFSLQSDLNICEDALGGFRLR